MMRGRILLALAALTVLLAWPAREVETLRPWLGLVILAAAIVALGYIPYRPKGWRMGGLFRRPGPGETWCIHCGNPAPSAGCSCEGATARRSASKSQAPNRRQPLRKRA